MIKIDDLEKVEIKVGKILSAENIEGSEKLLKLEVDFGEEKRQILSGIAKYYNPEDLVGKQTIFVTNLEPRQMMGLESAGMLLASGTKDKVVLFEPTEEITPGSRLG